MVLLSSYALSPWYEHLELIFLQKAFSHLIGESNELTQDLTSQGMSIVHRLGDVSMKGKLIHAQVNTLTGAEKTKRPSRCINFLQFSTFYEITNSLFI
jgi:proteasome component ECM29